MPKVETEVTHSSGQKYSLYKGMEGLREDTDRNVIPLPDIVPDVLINKRLMEIGRRRKENGEGEGEGRGSETGPLRLVGQDHCSPQKDSA